MTLWITIPLILAGSMVILELSARAYIRTRRRHYVWKPGTRMRLELDRAVFPQMEPVAHFIVNKDGERGDPPPERNDPRSTYRVLVAGGSAAECYFLDQESSWPGVVQAILNEPASLRKLNHERAHVGNIARSLFGSEYLDQLFTRILPEYEQLDLVVLMVGATDVVKWIGAGGPATWPPMNASEDILFEEHPRQRLGFGPKSCALAEIARRLQMRVLKSTALKERAGKKLGEVREMRRRAKEMRNEVGDPSPMLDRFEHHFDRLLRKLSEKTRVLVIQQPHYPPPHPPADEALMWGCGIGDPYRSEVTVYYQHEIVSRLMNQMNARAAKVASSLGIECLDLMPILEPSAKTYYDFFHLTPAGAKAVGLAVTQRILSGKESPVVLKAKGVETVRA